jgi:hypothetical protein
VIVVGRRELGRSGRRLSVGSRAAGQHPRPGPRVGRQHVALSHPADRGDAQHHAPYADATYGALGELPSRERHLPRRRRKSRDRRHRPCVPHDRRRPETPAWLGNCVATDAKGFVKTGPEILPADLAAAKWALTRPPLLFETSLSRCLRGRRRARGERQARGGGGGRGLGLRTTRATKVLAA